MSEEMISLDPFHCSGQCGRVLGYHEAADPHTRMATVICQHCMDHPEEIANRLRMNLD